jgi:predicted anti-sigma-YlaC factor YlaD
MTCHECERGISRLMDGEAKASDSANLFDHLTGCGACREFFDTLGRLNIEIERRREFGEASDAQEARHGRGADSHALPPVTGQRGLFPRPSTVAVAVVTWIIVGLLFSVNITIEKPQPSATPGFVETGESVGR